MNTVTVRVVVNLLLVALGYFIKRVGLITRDEGRVLNRLVLFVTLPALNLLVISRAELSWQLFLLPVIFLAAGFLISQGAKLPARWLNLDRGEAGTFIVSLCGVMGSLSYPFVEAAYGEPGVRAVAISDLGNAIAIFAFAYTISYRYAQNGHFSTRQILRKLLTFFPLHAFLLAVVLNLVGVQWRGLPAEFIGSLASLNSPLMLLGLGIYLEVNISHDESKVLITHLLYKYTLGFALAFFCFFALPFRGATRGAIFILALMPSSLSTLLYSVEQELSPRLAAMLISLSMLVSLAITTVTVLAFRHLF